MILSNKGILAVLWELFPGHPNLLPAAFEPGRIEGAVVRKPLLSREGANVAVERDGAWWNPGGPYRGPYVYQAAMPPPSFDGNHAVVGSWMIASRSAGISIREDDTPVTLNYQPLRAALFPVGCGLPILFRSSSWPARRPAMTIWMGAVSDRPAGETQMAYLTTLPQLRARLRRQPTRRWAWRWRSMSSVTPIREFTLVEEGQHTRRRSAWAARCSGSAAPIGSAIAHSRDLGRPAGLVDWWRWWPSSWFMSRSTCAGARRLPRKIAEEQPFPRHRARRPHASSVGLDQRRLPDLVNLQHMLRRIAIARGGAGRRWPAGRPVFSRCYRPAGRDADARRRYCCS